ncbi:hypothetical protein [Burkholderia pseudomallei]|uniref:hypothetical protein n=1 Tax=Burkholderia pseudomallei TaxID=28450 RepID=UPI001E4E0C86|nr:hypothetical protein [Burkholderia pseudomallei]
MSVIGTGSCSPRGLRPASAGASAAALDTGTFAGCFIRMPGATPHALNAANAAHSVTRFISRRTRAPHVRFGGAMPPASPRLPIHTSIDFLVPAGSGRKRRTNGFNTHPIRAGRR